jgi:hypothetical protein
VIKIATGPVILGTMQLLTGWEIEKGAPPIIIWHDRVYVKLNYNFLLESCKLTEGLRFGMEEKSNVRAVPTAIGPVLVTVRAGFAI